MRVSRVPATRFGKKGATQDAAPSSAAFMETKAPRPKRDTAWPDSSVPAMKAADPAPRTHPYGKPRPCSAEPSASASATGVSGASTEACATLTSRRNATPRAGR